MMRPVKVASKLLYETSAVSLFACRLTSALLTGHGLAYHAHTLMLFCLFPFDVFPYGFSSKTETACSLGSWDMNFSKS